MSSTGKRGIIVGALLAGLMVASADPAGAASAPDPGAAPDIAGHAAPAAKFRAAPAGGIDGSYIVKLKDGPTGAGLADIVSRLAARHRATVTHVYRSLNGFAARLPAAQALALSSEPLVEYVEQDGRTTALDVQPDPPSWGLDRIDQRPLPLNRSYTYPNTGAGVHAYILDTGLRETHTDFGGRATRDADFVAQGAFGADCNGHGTHVAGTIGGTTFGVAKQVRLHAVKVLGTDCGRGGQWSWFIAGMDWVITSGARPALINASLGGGPNAAADAAVARATSAGITVILSAGNDNADACNFSPVAAPSAITVANTTATDARHIGSNYGRCVDLFAPGTAIVSAGIATDTSTASRTGTSMAAPHVAGTVAMLLQRNPAATPAQVTATVLNRATPNLVTDAKEGTPNLLLFAGNGG